jgi:hypothetical protein
MQSARGESRSRYRRKCRIQETRGPGSKEVTASSTCAGVAGQACDQWASLGRRAISGLVTRPSTADRVLTSTGSRLASDERKNQQRYQTDDATATADGNSVTSKREGQHDHGY